MPDRRTPFSIADEKQTLVDFLDYLRDSMVLKLVGLGEADARRPLVPSGTNLMWLVKHLTLVEVAWFQYSFAGKYVTVPTDDLIEGDTVSSVVTAYRAAIETSNKIVAGCSDLDQRCVRPGTAPEPMTLRWVLVHMVEETGRHAGHADILREQIDGDTGR